MCASLKTFFASSSSNLLILLLQVGEPGKLLGVDEIVSGHLHHHIQRPLLLHPLHLHHHHHRVRSGKARRVSWSDKPAQTVSSPRSRYPANVCHGLLLRKANTFIYPYIKCLTCCPSSRKILQELVSAGDLDGDGGLNWEEFEGFGNFEFAANWFGWAKTTNAQVNTFE